MDADIFVLANSPLFEGLRWLEVSDARLTGAGIKSIARSPAAKTLQFLNVEGNEFVKSGLDTIAKPGTFPNLTALHLGVAGIGSRRALPEDVAQFLRSWEHPALRHLNLNYWNHGDVGAKALAGNPAFGNLRWLSINYAGKLGRVGLRAIVESPHLKNLVYLSLLRSARGGLGRSPARSRTPSKSCELLDSPPSATEEPTRGSSSPRSLGIKP
jgi:hypothetical protein